MKEHATVPSGESLPAGTIAFPDTDADLAEALESAHIPTLMMVLAQLTGDTSLLRAHEVVRSVPRFARVMA